MFEIEYLVVRSGSEATEKGNFKVNFSTNLETIRRELERYGSKLRFIHKRIANLDKYLKDPVDWEKISDSRYPLIIFCSSIEFPRTSKVTQNPTGKNKYNMKNPNDIAALFSEYNLSPSQQAKFILTALESIKNLDGYQEFDEILESPFISRLLKDNSTLRLLASNIIS